MNLHLNHVNNCIWFQKDERRLALAKTLKWPPFDEDQNMQEAIKLDFLFDSMNFAVEKGFPWNKIAFIVQFADKLTEEIKCKYSCNSK